MKSFKSTDLSMHTETAVVKTLLYLLKQSHLKYKLLINLSNSTVLTSMFFKITISSGTNFF